MFIYICVCVYISEHNYNYEYIPFGKSTLSWLDSCMGIVGADSPSSFTDFRVFTKLDVFFPTGRDLLLDTESLLLEGSTDTL